MGNQQLIFRSLLLLFSIVLTAVGAFAQPGPITTQAIQRVQTGDLMAAQTAIVQALQSKEEGQSAYTWYVKGYIFKEIYKDIDKGNPQSENRDVAVEAILHSMDLLAKQPSAEGELNENNTKALSYLALSYYNDAVLLTRSLSAAHIEAPERYYLRYKTLYKRIEPNRDFAAQDVEFYKNMARGCRLIYEKDPLNSSVYYAKSNAYLQQAIDLAPNDFQANYNLAVSHYNHGVYKIKQIDHNTEIYELIRIQDECIALFKLALPYMRKAHELKPDHRKTLGGLMAIYRSLSENDQASTYQQLLEELIRQNKLDD
jgi:tetratricopeptide (TPR) repeat protein